MGDVIYSKEHGNSMNGLWTAEFGSSTGTFGSGVAVFQDGKVLGGDSTYYYVGEYEFKGNEFRATLKSSPFIQGAVSLFTTVGRDLMLEINGELTDQDRAIAQGHVRGMENITFGLKLTRRH